MAAAVVFEVVVDAEIAADIVEDGVVVDVVGAKKDHTQKYKKKW